MAENMNDNRPKQIDNGFSKFLWWLAAADAEILKDCPTDKERYRIVGIAVLVTWLFATLAWGYFFSTVVEDDLVIAGLALFFGFAILSIDRSLIAAMSRNGGKPQFLPVAFRLVLAVTIGLFISQPVVLMLFKKDIDAQMVLDRQSKLDHFRKEQAALNESLTKPLNQQIAIVNNQLTQKEEQVKEYKDSYIRETDGTGGSGKIGESSIAKVKKNEYLKSEEELRKLKKELDAQRLEKEAQLAVIRTEDSLKEQAYVGTLTNGFLSQIEALNTLTDEHPPLKQRYRLIVFIITLIEIMPLLTKLLMPKGEYDERLAAMTAGNVQAAQLGLEKGQELNTYYYDAATVADKEVMDHLFRLTETQRRREAEEVVKEWEASGSKRFKQLWNNARRLLLLHKV
jgi:hypothetical protein